MCRDLCFCSSVVTSYNERCLFWSVGPSLRMGADVSCKVLYEVFV